MGRKHNKVLTLAFPDSLHSICMVTEHEVVWDVLYELSLDIEMVICQHMLKPAKYHFKAVALLKIFYLQFDWLIKIIKKLRLECKIKHSPSGNDTQSRSNNTRPSCLYVPQSRSMPFIPYHDRFIYKSRLMCWYWWNAPTRADWKHV